MDQPARPARGNVRPPAPESFRQRNGGPASVACVLLSRSRTAPWQLRLRRPAIASLPIIGRTLPHSKLITAAAREALRPMGMVQKGRSRTRLDDRRWWVGVVAFQASNWSRGSYLNVAVHCLWNDKGHISFDVGGRVSGFGQGSVSYDSDEQFRPLAINLAKVAATRIAEQRDRFRTLEDAAAHLRPRRPGASGPRSTPPRR